MMKIVTSVVGKDDNKPKKTQCSVGPKPDSPLTSQGRLTTQLIILTTHPTTHITRLCTPDSPLTSSCRFTTHLTMQTHHSPPEGSPFTNQPWTPRSLSCLISMRRDSGGRGCVTTSLPVSSTFTSSFPHAYTHTNSHHLSFQQIDIYLLSYFLHDSWYRRTT